MHITYSNNIHLICIMSSVRVQSTGHVKRSDKILP